MSFDISIDYRFDTSGFFSQTARTTMEAAADAWEALIADEFDRVPAGLSFTISNPSDGASDETVTLSQPIDDLLIFVGTQDPPFGKNPGGDTLARAGVRGFDNTGDALKSRISANFRDQGPVTDFEPFLGAISFDPSRDWSFDLEGPVSGKHDLFSVALHEIGHVLGIGQAEIFKTQTAGQSFDGVNARAVNDGEPIPLSEDESHTDPSVRDGENLLSPTLTIGQRQEITDIEKAFLADIGYEIDGFTAQGRTPDIATDQAERLTSTIFGTAIDDLLNGFGGDDQIQGMAGDDIIHGSNGDDLLFGMEGNDRLLGGPGDDQLQGGPGRDLLHAGPGKSSLFGEAGVDTFYVAPGDFTDNVTKATATAEDFDPANETILVDPGFGFESIDAILDKASRPFNNITRLDLTPPIGPRTLLDVRHESTMESPLTADNIRIGRPQALAGASLNGSPLAQDDAVVLSGDSVDIPVLSNDADPDGHELTPVVVSQPETGTLQPLVTGDGTALRFTPNETFEGVARFEYSVSDGHGGLDTAEVVVAREMPTPSVDLLGAPLDAQASALYVGYFGRAADPAGLDFWTGELRQAVRPIAEGGKGTTSGQALKDMAEGMRLGDEAQTLFPVIDPDRDPSAVTVDEIATFVDAVFQNLFNRSPEGTPDDPETGLGFWVGTLGNRFDKGINIGDAIVDIISGASGSDVATFNAKAAVALNFARNMDAQRFDALPDGKAAARHVIADVGSDPTTIAAGATAIGDLAITSVGASFAPTEDLLA